MNENRGISPAWVVVVFFFVAWMADIRPSTLFLRGSDRSEPVVEVTSQEVIAQPAPQSGGVSADIQALQAQIAEQQRLIEQQMQQVQVESALGGGGDQAGGGSPQTPLSAPIERDTSGSVAGIGDGADLNNGGIVVTSEKQSTDGTWFAGYGRIYAVLGSDTTAEACYTAYIAQGGGENPPVEPVGCGIQWEWHKK